MHSQHVQRSLFVGIFAPLLCLPLTAQNAAPPAQDESTLVLHISAHEVVLDVVARDEHHGKYPLT